MLEVVKNLQFEIGNNRIPDIKVYSNLKETFFVILAEGVLSGEPGSILNNRFVQKGSFICL